MQLVLISDTHGQHQSVDVPAGDVLIHSGDLTLDGEREVVLDFVSWLAEQPHKHKIFIAGNHDRWVQDNSDELMAVSRQLGVHYLQESSVKIDGVHFWGSPYTPEYMNWAFMLPCENSAVRHWQQMPDDIDVLITHGPPAGILDNLVIADRELDDNSGENEIGVQSEYRLISRGVGCSALASRVLQVAPQCHVFGHIHEAYGSQTFGRTRFVNASCMNREYSLANPAHVISVNGLELPELSSNTFVLNKKQDNLATERNDCKPSVLAAELEGDLSQPALSEIAS